MSEESPRDRAAAVLGPGKLRQLEEAGLRIVTDRESPRRRVQATIEIGADSWEDLRGALHSLYRRVAEAEHRGESEIDLTSGGHSWGGWMKADEDESVTHESYFEASQEWLEGREAGEGAQDGR